MASENKILDVHMFDGFQITWGGEPLHLSMGSATKAMQFLQIILLRGKNGITREELVKYLSEGYELSDPSNSLRVTHYRLRKLLAQSGLPECDYIQIKKGSYYWNYEIPLKTDTGEFEELVKKADAAKAPDERERFQKKACRLYKGDLLPMLGAEEWVVLEGSYYKRAYIKTLNELFANLKRQGEYTEIAELAAQAGRIFPYEEWQLHQIESLMALGRYDEALDIYNKTSRLYMLELGISPSRKMQDLYRELSGKMQGNADSLEDIRTQIQEQSVDTGAFYCNLLSFVDTCRILSRIGERSDEDMSLMLCTLKEYGSDMKKRSRKIENEMILLKDAIQKALRKGDFFTKYSPCQYLIFLTGTTKNNGPVVSRRIEDAFSAEYPQERGSLGFSMTSVFELEKQWSSLDSTH